MNEITRAEDELRVQPIPGLSVKGLLGVFTGPTEFFNQLVTQPKVLVPYLVFSGILAIFLFATGDIMGQLQMDLIKASGREIPPQALNPEMLKWSYIGGGLFAMSLFPLLASSLALFFGNFVFGGTAKFKAMLSVVLYAGIVYMVGGLVTLPLIFAKGSMLVSLSLAAAIPEPDMQSMLYMGLSKIGVFNIWEVIVAGIGFSAVYKFSRNKGYLLAVLSIGLLSALQVVLTGIFN